MRVDIEPLPDRPFHVEADLYALPDLGIMTAGMSEFRLIRTPELVADGNADFRLAVNISGAETVFQRGRKVTLDVGDATLVSMAETGGIVRHAPGQRVGLNIPYKVLAPLVSNIDAAAIRKIPRDTPALNLLMGYLNLLRDHDALATPELRRLAASHIHDLLALVLGATKDAEAIAQGRGARAAPARDHGGHCCEHRPRRFVGRDREHDGIGSAYVTFKGCSRPMERRSPNS